MRIVMCGSQLRRRCGVPLVPIVCRFRPNLRFAGFSLWVLGREFPDSHDFWDGNWLLVRARMEAPDGCVEARGPIIHASALEAFANQLALLDAALIGDAALDCIAPDLHIAFCGERLGRVVAAIWIAADHMTQRGA